MSSSDVKVPNSRIFRERAEEYPALDSFRSEEMRAASLRPRG